MIVEKILNAKIKGLKVLDLSDCHYERLPDSITRLPELEELIIGKYFDYKAGKDKSDGKCSLIELPEGLGKLTNLKKLVLSGGGDFSVRTEISNFTPIWELKNLETLILQGTNIKSLERISELRNLKHLSLDNTRLDDYSPIKKLQNLETLQLGDIGLDSIEFLSTNISIKNLSVTTNNINSLKPLSGLVNLENICACKNPLNAGIVGLESNLFQSICLKETNIDNFGFLRGLPFLKKIYGSKITFNDIERNEELEDVFLNNVTNEQMSLIGKHSKLKYLGIQGNINSLGTIGNLKHLEYLKLETPKLKSLHRLTNEELKILICYGKLDSINPLEGHRNLMVLFLDGSPIKTIEPLRSCLQLRNLSIIDSDIKSIEPIIRHLGNRHFKLRLKRNRFIRNIENILDEKGVESLQVLLEFNEI